MPSCLLLPKSTFRNRIICWSVFIVDQLVVGNVSTICDWAIKYVPRGFSFGLLRKAIVGLHKQVKLYTDQRVELFIVVQILNEPSYTYPFITFNSCIKMETKFPTKLIINKKRILMPSLNFTIFFNTYPLIHKSKSTEWKCSLLLYYSIVCCY